MLGKSLLPQECFRNRSNNACSSASFNKTYTLLRQTLTPRMIHRRCLVSLAGLSCHKYVVRPGTGCPRFILPLQQAIRIEYRLIQERPQRSLHGSATVQYPAVAGSSWREIHTAPGTAIRRRRPRYALPLVLGLLLLSYGLYTFSPSDEPSEFKPYRLAARDDVSTTSALFTIRPVKGGLPEPPRGVIWSVEFKQPYIQIGRDYTVLPPLDNTSNSTDGSLKFLIRKDPKGEMSKYLSSLPIGATIGVRGPKTELRIPSGIKKLVFFAGGTGIAPALQAANAVLSQEESSLGSGQATVHILWANRRREDCEGAPTSGLSLKSNQSSWLGALGELFSNAKSGADVSVNTSMTGPIVRNLEHLSSRYPGQVKVEYFIDEEGTFIDQKVVSRVVSEAFSSGRGAGSSSQIIISGPEGFISHIAGPKMLQYSSTGSESELRASQGPIGGLLRQTGIDGAPANVFKL